MTLENAVPSIAYVRRTGCTSVRKSCSKPVRELWTSRECAIRGLSASALPPVFQHVVHRSFTATVHRLCTPVDRKSNASDTDRVGGRPCVVSPSRSVDRTTGTGTGTPRRRATFRRNRCHRVASVASPEPRAANREPRNTNHGRRASSPSPSPGFESRVAVHHSPFAVRESRPNRDLRLAESRPVSRRPRTAEHEP